MEPETIVVTKSEAETRSGWIKGCVLALPIVFGYLPVGFAYGILAQKNGLSGFNTLMMSLLVYGGASQFIAVGLMAAGAPPWTVITTTFVVNLRHLIMSAALSIRLKSWRLWERAAFSYQLTDESFAIHVTRFDGPPPTKPTVFGINLTAQMAWIAGTWIGVAAGAQIADIRPFALDYALIAMFIALIAIQIRRRLQILVVFVSGGAAVLMLRLGVDQWHVMAATLFGATVGAGLDLWIKKRYS